PYDPRRVRTTPPHDEDDRYWHEYHATPKAFVSLATGRKLWSSRFGRTTSIRIPPAEGLTEAELAGRLEQELAAHKESLGFVFRPVKRQGLAASRGTTDFNGLFLGFSFFIIASAVMLAALLFRLGVERRASEIGTLAAVGFGARRVRWLLSAEGLLISLAGGALGLAGGLGFAWLMLAGLRDPRWWLAAVSAPFLHLHLTWRSLAIGYAAGVAVSWLAIVWSLWRMSKVSVRRLLAGQASGGSPAVAARTWLSQTVAWLSLIAAIALAAMANRLTGEAQAGAFFGSGALVLTALLALVWSRLRGGGAGAVMKPGGRGVRRLALRNAARNPGRSTLTIGLVAAASFLIVAVSAFRLAPPESTAHRDGGSGGFSLMAESDQPLYQDLGAAAGREELGLSADDNQLLEDGTMVSLRVKPGDDASCLNLYQPSEPRVLGVSEALIERGGFAWSATAAASAEEKKNPWRLLDRPLADDAGGERRIPVILDANTATYSLHLDGVGSKYSVNDGRGGQVVLEVVGLLKNSIFQGDLLISEKAFLAHFPEISGYRFFLIDVPPEKVTRVETMLERALGDAGFDAQPTRRRLSELMAVQNTYLSTFQSLGGLGLVLGTFGLAVVQLRNVLERRGEMALLRAAGFRRALLGRMVLIENAALLVAGLAVGIGAALVAVWPHLASGGASLPWVSLAVTMALVLLTGLAAGVVALRAALTAPLLPALRGD
ncbi:MAG TPA: ABC transporter permease, partial [Pirellulales bacterium]|nr:ABC transporter permease [Pirellulales bacterium]